MNDRAAGTLTPDNHLAPDNHLPANRRNERTF
jgi:hypothetical protein